MKQFIFLLFFIILAYSAIAQRSCATDELRNLGKTPTQILQEQETFERWLVLKKNQSINKNGLQGQTEITVYQIPVVVHIIHNGEAIGEGLNISVEQVRSQIQVLNQDFRHLNPDSINTPPLFQPLTADVGFEFVLAKQDPNGFYTNGITRTDGQKSSWNFGLNSELKSLSYWPSESYLNIWVTNTQRYLGWAEFPLSDLIEGGSFNATNNPLTDGVVVRTGAFGSVEFYPQGNYKPNYDLGRTASHEIGHFFGLHHIWGPSVSPSCNLDDFVLDTPNSSREYFKCPSFGAESTSCNSQDMFMNYMDYVDDRCMNLFSKGQKERMITVINNSPRRASLLNSKALLPLPVLDASLLAMPSPEAGTCANKVVASASIQNNGTVTLTEVALKLLVNYAENEELIFPITLLPSQDTTLIFSEIVLKEFGTLDFRTILTTVNGITDDSLYNNQFDKQVFFSEVVTSISEDFSTWPQSWAKSTSAALSNWNGNLAPNLEVENSAAQLRYYQNPSSFNDNLISQVLDVSGMETPYLIFDYAYGKRDGYIDALSIMVSKDCGNSFTDTLLNLEGNELATTQFEANFTPSGPIDWKSVVINLAKYKNQPIQLAFVGSSGGGNNIYLDNFKLVDQNYVDVGIKGLENESGAFSTSLTTIGLLIENEGTTIISNLTIETGENNKSLFSSQFSNLNLLPGEQRKLDLENKFTERTHLLSFRILLDDSVDANNEFISPVNFISSSVLLPARENFNNFNWNIDKIWTINSPLDSSTWNNQANSNDFLTYPSYSIGNAGLHDWLVLPLLDLSKTSLASVQYNLAYASNDINAEVLRIWLSTTGGASYDYLLEEFTGKEMATHHSTKEWYPKSEGDWETRYLDLRDFVGEEEVLIGFQGIDGDGNNIYLDEIEIFVTENGQLTNIGDDGVALYPNPITSNTSYFTFNLRIRQDVMVEISDLTGKVISKTIYKNVLNQTYSFDTSSLPNSIYITKVKGITFSQSAKIIVKK